MKTPTTYTAEEVEKMCFTCPYRQGFIDIMDHILLQMKEFKLPPIAAK